MTFPEKLQKRLDELGWNQADLVRRTGVDKSTVSYWFQNKTNRFPRLGDAAKLARTLGVSLDYLADDEIEAPPEGLSDEERFVLRSWRLSGLDADSAVAAWQGLGPARIIRTRVQYSGPVAGAPPPDPADLDAIKASKDRRSNSHDQATGLESVPERRK